MLNEKKDVYVALDTLGRPAYLVIGEELFQMKFMATVGGEESDGSLSREAFRAKITGAEPPKKKKGERICGKCGEAGHRKDNCPNTKKEDEDEEVV